MKTIFALAVLSIFAIPSVGFCSEAPVSDPASADGTPSCGDEVRPADEVK